MLDISFFRIGSAKETTVILGTNFRGEQVDVMKCPSSDHPGVGLESPSFPQPMSHGTPLFLPAMPFASVDLELNLGWGAAVPRLPAAATPLNETFRILSCSNILSWLVWETLAASA